jgi:transposase
MEDVSIIGVDLAKNLAQLHGAEADGPVVFRKKVSRLQFGRFTPDHPACEVAMETCPSAHHWARALTVHGPLVRLIAPHYVKPFLKRQKNDSAGAKAIAKAALRPTMRSVKPKTAEQQARAVVLLAREQLLKQRIEATNALRGHLHEFGHIALDGIGYVLRLAQVVEDPGSGLPDLARAICGRVRRLLVTVAMAFIRWALRRSARRNPWLARLLERKLPMVATFALANKMARGTSAMQTRCRPPRRNTDLVIEPDGCGV